MAEFDIGKRCSFSDCGRLDFLPIYCNFCKHVFCKNHISGDSHNCEHNQDNYVLNPGTVDGYMCTIGDCTKSERVPVKCPCCKLNFCLKHRHCDDHDCIQCLYTKAEKVRDGPAIIVQQMLDAAKRTKVAPKKKTATSAKSRRIQALVDRQRIRAVAKGDSRVADVDRCYFRVRAYLTDDDDSVTTTTAVFVSAKWSVGRCIDSIAAEANVRNENNAAGSVRVLRLFPDGGEDDSDVLSPLSDQIEQFIASGVLYDGATLVLRRVTVVTTDK